jgi:hypothetical protein
MTDQIPYADYVRIEIHAGGKAQIIEFRPDGWQKVKAQVGFVDPPTDLIHFSEDLGRRPSSYPHLVVDVQGPTATVTIEGSDR